MATVIDDLHDLTITVGPEDSSDRQSFKVNSTILKVFSKVWRAMLSGAFAESSMNEIHFPDDSLEAFHIVLLIAHYKPLELPETLALNELQDLAMLCDKYFVTDMVQIYVVSKKWLLPHLGANGPWQKDLDAEQLQDWILILTSFNRIDAVGKAELLVDRLAMKAIILDGKLKLGVDDLGDAIVPREELPESVLSRVRCVREAVIRDLFSSLSSLYYHALNDKTCAQDGDICHSTKIGFMITICQEMDLFPFPDSEALMTRSVEHYLKEFKSKIDKIQGWRYGGYNRACYFSTCMSSLADAEKEIFWRNIEKHTQKGFRDSWEKVHQAGW